MRNLGNVGSAMVAVALLAGCRAGSTSSVLPLVVSAERSETNKRTSTSGASLTVCIVFRSPALR